MNRHEEYVKPWRPACFASDLIGDVHITTIICRTGRTTRVADTMIFLNGTDVAGLTNLDCEQGPVDQAQEQHDRWVAKVRQAVQA
jgi:hypothetical protein